MKTKPIYLMIAFAVACGMIVSVSSCKKSKLDKETTTDEDNSLAEDMFDDVHKNVSDAAVSEAGVKSAGSYSFTNACTGLVKTFIDANNKTITSATKKDSIAFPVSLTMDFGNGVTCDDGRTRKGKLLSTLTGRHNTPGSVITTTLQNYYVNDYKVEGTKKITNKGNYTWEVVVTGGKITSPENKIVSWESTKTRTQTVGQATDSIIFDDVYTITGSASGINREGRKYTLTIKEALQLQMNCGGGRIPEVTKGKVEIQPEDLTARTVDFGNGTCDNEASVSVAGNTLTFKLRR